MKSGGLLRTKNGKTLPSSIQEPGGIANDAPILNSLAAHIAVLAPDGTILLANHAWSQFARQNENSPMRGAVPGANYLDECRRAASEGVPGAEAALKGIQSVLHGKRRAFELEYPCHSARKQRCFLMHVSPFKGANRGAVVSHTDVTDRKAAEIAVQRSESTIRALLESSTQSVLAVDAKEKIVLANGNTEAMFGYKREELLGQRLDILIPEDFRGRHAAHHRTYFANMRNRPMGIGLDLTARRKEGSTFPVEIALSGIETAEGKFAVAFVTDISERRRMEQAGRMHEREIQALTASLLTAHEEERRRVSRELHDQICQQLASLAIELGGLAAAPPPADREKRLKELQARVIKTSEMTRHIAYQMHPSILDDLGLVASLRSLCREFSERTADIELNFSSGEAHAPVSREVASCLYRIAQQSLENIAQHAAARHVSVTLQFRKGTASLTIADDGVGFDISVVQGQGGLGLIGMAERARSVHAKFSISTRPGQGTRIAVEVPLSGSHV
jgi:PAS domain S-box-containing protein